MQYALGLPRTCQPSRASIHLTTPDSTFEQPIVSPPSADQVTAHINSPAQRPNATGIVFSIYLLTPFILLSAITIFSQKIKDKSNLVFYTQSTSMVYQGKAHKHRHGYTHTCTYAHVHMITM